MKITRHLSRRDFIKILGSASAAITLAACTSQRQEMTSSPATALPTQVSSPTAETGATATDRPAENNNPQVTSTAEPVGNSAYLAVARGTDAAAMTTAVLTSLGGMERFVKSGANVILKPNICTNYYSYEYAATTNPDVVAALVRLCFAAGAGRVRVMDLPFGGSAESAYETSGIAAAVGSAGGEMEVMNPHKFLDNQIPGGLDIHEWSLYQDALDADVLINIPIAKTHGLTRLTLGGKNLMGLIENRGGIHANIHQRVADLVSVFQPELTVIDATRILVANGPTGGNLDDVRVTNTVIASADIVAADAYAATLFGLQGSDIGYIQAAANMGLGQMDLSQVDSRGNQYLNPITGRRLRQISQILFFILFTAGLAFASREGWILALSKSFFHLDLLATLTASIAGRLLIGGGFLALLTFFLSILFGRVWCGWICPFGTLLDWISPRKRSLEDGRLEKWRVVKYILFFVILIAAILGNQTLMFLDPLTILSRTLAGVVFPAIRYTVFQTESFFYQFKSLWGILDAIHNHILTPLSSTTEAVFIQAFPIFLFLLIIVGLNWIAVRFWCRYLCPLGGILGLLSKLSLFRRTVSKNCSACSRCRSHCPTGTIRARENFRSDPAECILCFDCAAECPVNAIQFSPISPWKPAKKEIYDPGRREILVSAGVAAFGAALAGVETFRIVKPANFIRPPGVVEERFESLCIRCGECVLVCPTNGLQPVLFEAGWHNIMTPILVPRLGACNYNCNACGSACPSGAIPALSLVDKQLQVMGLARIDQDRCLPWAYQTSCIICEEACPLPQKAIQLTEETETGPKGETILLQKPRVVKELCIGCGICEHQCPQGGEAAVRVFCVPDSIFQPDG